METSTQIYVKDWTTCYTPEQRARALYYFLGWQGGTVHQLAKATGLTVSQILYEPLNGYDGYAVGTPRELSRFISDKANGSSAVRTCDREYRANTLAPAHKGDFEFWGGVIRGFWITGPLDE